MGKVKIGLHCRYIDKSFREMSLEKSCTKHMNFVQAAELPWQPKIVNGKPQVAGQGYVFFLYLYVLLLLLLFCL